MTDDSASRSPSCDSAGRLPPTAEDLAIRETARIAGRARLVRGQWTDAGAGLQVRLA